MVIKLGPFAEYTAIRDDSPFMEEDLFSYSCLQYAHLSFNRTSQVKQPHILKIINVEAPNTGTQGFALNSDLGYHLKESLP